MTGATAAHVQAVNLDDFQRLVVDESYRRPVMVDFWAEWCPPCIAIAPLLERAVADFEGSVALAKIEVDEGDNMKLAGRYQVRGFPTVLLVQDGEERGRFSGAKSYAFIEHFIESHARVG